MDEPHVVSSRDSIAASRTCATPLPFNEAALYQQIKLFTAYYHESRTLFSLARTRRTRTHCSQRKKDESWLSHKRAVAIAATTGAQPEHAGSRECPQRKCAAMGVSLLSRPPIATDCCVEILYPFAESKPSGVPSLARVRGHFCSCTEFSTGTVEIIRGALN
jgi:hypothetical protein